MADEGVVTGNLEKVLLKDRNELMLALASVWQKIGSLEDRLAAQEALNKWLMKQWAEGK